MSIELRPVTEEEFPEAVRSLEDGFGFHADEDNLADILRNTELPRTLCAFDDDELVATAGAYTFDLTVPGGALVPSAGVTFVTVKASHRRRGILTSIMAEQLDDVADRGEPLALLTASESLIYPRFGYGLGTLGSDWRIESDHAALRYPATPPGRIRLVDAAVVGEHAPRLYDASRLRTPGAVNRNDEWWASWLKDPPHMRQGSSKRWYLVHESDAGQVDGFCTYRRKSKYEHGFSYDVAVLDQVFADTDEIEHAFIQYLLEKDLIHAVEAHGRPLDEPFRWRLADQRRLQTTDVIDNLWVRVVDPCAALSSRRYATADRLVIEVVDPFRPSTNGCFVIEGDVDGAACSRSDGPADLTMDVADLGAIYLGGVVPTSLHRAGRITENTSGAIARADAFFVSTPAPWMTTGF